MCIFDYIYVYVHAHTYIHDMTWHDIRLQYSTVHTYIRTYLPTYLHTYLPTYLHTYLPTYIPTYLPTYIHTYIRTYTYIHTYVYIYNSMLFKQIMSNIDISTRLSIPRPSARAYVPRARKVLSCGEKPTAEQRHRGAFFFAAGGATN